MSEEKITILVKVDESCEMACVKVGNRFIMEGNFWDFHPGCHGLYEFGDFNGYASLVQAIYKKLLSEGVKAQDIIVEKQNYKWH